MSDAFDFDFGSRGPIDRTALDSVIAAVQARLDLVLVLREMFNASLEIAGARWRTSCLLPSTIDGFEGTCADQDASTKGGSQAPANLWVSEGDRTRVWRCFSCGRHGDVIDLIEHAEGRTRSTGLSVSLSAVRRAASLAGVLYMLEGRAPDDRDDVTDDFVSTNAPKRIAQPTATRVEFKRARAINARAAKHWHEMLKSGPGYLARNELTRRGVTDEQRDRYVLGYAANEWRDLVGALPPAALPEAQVLGLVGSNKRTGDLYDRYRHRIMFPYCEPACDGRLESITGFAGRTLDTAANSPKWYNSTNTDGVWSKGSALLGLLQARQRMGAAGTDRIAVGEGGWEVLAFDRIGVPCVGLVAAPMSLDHVHVLVTVLQARRVTLAGDGDETGRRGLFAGAISLLKYGFTIDDIDVIDPPDGLDPGAMGETVEGSEQLAAAWAEPQRLVDFLAARETVARDQQKRALVAVLPHDLARDFADRWGVDFDREPEPDESLTSTASFVAQLLAKPALALQLAGDHVRHVFANDMLASRQLDALRFGTSTTLLELPPSLRAAWLACYADYLDREIAAHESTDKFAGGKGHASFIEWFDHGDELRAQQSQARRMLASLQSPG